MIALNPNISRNRAMFAFHALFSGPAEDEHLDVGIPAAIRLARYNLIAVAGDPEQPLSFMTLRPLAVAQGCDVIATWLEPIRSGHRFLFDLVLHRAGAVTHYREYRLWLGKRGPMYFVPENGRGAAIMVDDRELRLVKRSPIRNPIARIDGLAVGQAVMQRLVYSNTPYATPRAHHVRD